MVGGYLGKDGYEKDYFKDPAEVDGFMVKVKVVGSDKEYKVPVSYSEIVSHTGGGKALIDKATRTPSPILDSEVDRRVNRTAIDKLLKELRKVGK